MNAFESPVLWTTYTTNCPSFAMSEVGTFTLISCDFTDVGASWTPSICTTASVR